MILDLLSGDDAPAWQVRPLLRRLPSDRDVRKVLFSREYENQGFLLSILRMTVGYRLGAVRFCLVSARLPA